jgi:hypothetical protein
LLIAARNGGRLGIVEIFPGGFLLELRRMASPPCDPPHPSHDPFAWKLAPPRLGAGNCRGAGPIEILPTVVGFLYVISHDTLIKSCAPERPLASVLEADGLKYGRRRRKMTETPESRSQLSKANAETLRDRIKAWRADYEALKAETDAAAKAKQESRVAEIRAKVAARQQR